MVTIKDVAKKANVSLSTVSRMLNNGYVKKETKERILKVIDELNFIPNSKAINLRSGYTHSIGCITPHIGANPGGEIVNAIEVTLRKNGYNLILIQALTPLENIEVSCTMLLREQKVDGIILISPREILQSDLEEIRSDGLPFILIDGDPNSGLACVAPNNYRGGYLATEHLIKLGHQRIAHISGPQKWYNCSERFRGYKEALQHYGIPFDPDLVVSSDLYIKEAPFIINQLLALPDPPSAIFALNDNMAAGSLNALSRNGLHVPEDMAVIGFDDIYYAEYFQPPLSTIHQPFDQIGETAALRLIDMVTKRKIDNSLSVFPVELIVRESTVKA
ncbi:MAG TPA: LacI family DNA-binding transcriptional regulator [Bacillota bacterium]|nr:LacI family DNA-binding transcriptional regulator [Bacillota bacterium]